MILKRMKEKEINEKMYNTVSIEKLVEEGILNQKESQVLEARIKNNYTYRKLSEMLNLSQERCRYLFIRALEKLRNEYMSIKNFKFLLLQDAEQAIRNIDFRITELKIEAFRLRTGESYPAGNQQLISRKIALIEEKIEELRYKANTIKENQNKTSIRVLNLSQRSLNGLLKADIVSVEQLIELINRDDIYKIRNIGKISKNEIITKVLDYQDRN